jgi:glutathione-regulated potassium-efflux system ancillary protein KefC
MESNLLLAIFVLLAATVLLVPLAKWAGLGTILGYLVAGILIGPYGLQLVSDSEVVRSVAEFGVVMMLFLIGLEVDADELWRMRHQVIGLGLSQMGATSVVLAVVFNLVGFAWPAAVVVGLALAMSSTAIAMQSVAQRNITKTDTGRGSLAVLLVQDVSVIPILAAIPLLAGMSGTPVEALGEEVLEAVDNPFDWWVALGLVSAFLLALAGSRFVIRPFLMPWIARAKVPEAFTAFALALVIGAALAAESFHLSPALGAFLGGVLLADSEYRHELESNLEPFKGLLLGLFFISVGMSIAFSVVIENPLMVIALVIALIGIKMAVLFGLASFFKMHIAERLLLAVLLSQAGEFAFVVLQFARTAGNLSGPEVELLTVVVALSMAMTPFLLFLYDRLWAPRLHSASTPAAKPPGPKDIDGRGKVMVLGYGRFGQIVTRLLRAQGFEMTLIDDDPAQIELVKRFGVKVFYGDGGRLDILRAAGIDETKMVVIAVAGGDRILSIATQIRRYYPQIIIAARAVDRSHAHDLMAIGVQVIERETFRSALRLGEQALVALGQTEQAAARVAGAFQQHDERMLRDSYAVRHDRDAYIGFVRRSTEMLDAVMKADRESVLDAEAELEDEVHEAQQKIAASSRPQSAGDAPEGDIDNAGKRASE